MAAKFTLSWDNNPGLANPIAQVQRASVRRKVPLGNWSTVGFNPTNDMQKTVNTAQSPDLLYNVVYQFIIETVCSTGASSINDNGIREAIQFQCVASEIAISHEGMSAYLDFTDTNIQAVEFTLKNESGDVIGGPEEKSVQLGGASFTFRGLEPSTHYILESVYIAMVNGTEIRSEACTEDIYTTAVPECPAPRNLSVTVTTLG